MKQGILVSLISVLLGGLLVWEFFPHQIPASPVIPHIITVHDTVSVLPKWYNDSIRAWKARKSTTDTVNIVITNTLVIKDTVYVGPDTNLRSRDWPILEYHGGSHFGDTALVRSFSLRSGNQNISRIFIPGILTDIQADSGSTPRMTFAPFPEPRRPPLLYRLKLMAMGYGACSIYNGVK